MNLTYGSRGDDVRKLQQALQSAGYDVGSTGADGVYGRNTQAAVRRYQQANGLSVDGIAGPNTLGRLYGASQSGGAQQGTLSGVSAGTEAGLSKPWTPPAASEAPDPAAPDLSYLDAAWEDLQGQGSFSYRLDEDPLYARYASLYRQWGRAAMEDASGQAAALTGGYGSTYADQAGASAYGDVLRQLGAMAPELYDRARSAYESDRSARESRFSAALRRAEGEQSRYESARSARRQEAADARDFSYREYQDLLDYWLRRAQLENEDYRWRQDYALRQAGL